MEGVRRGSLRELKGRGRKCQCLCGWGGGQISIIYAIVKFCNFPNFVFCYGALNLCTKTGVNVQQM